MSRIPDTGEMTIQSSVQIGDTIRKAMVFNVNNWREDTMNTDSLIQTVQDFFAILEQREIDYVLVGGIALLQYVEGRNTEDLDLLMAVSALDKLPELEIDRRDVYFVHAHYDDVPIDILLTQNPLFREVQHEHTQDKHFLERNITLATVEGLLLLKLYALPLLYHQGNFARVGLYENDIATLLHYYQTDVPKLLDTLASYVSANDLAEIKSIVADIQHRLKRFRDKTR